MSTITEGPIQDNLKLHLQGIGKKIDKDRNITDDTVQLAINNLTKAFIKTIK